MSPMEAAVHSDEDSMFGECIAQVAAAGTDAAKRDIFRRGFNRLRSRLSLYPARAAGASATFESAARTARDVAAGCLPLGIAVAMHLYPLCALQCVPLPRLSLAALKRSMLLRAIRNRSLILANAGSERTAGAHEPLVVTRARTDIRVDGSFEYVSLASVADVVLFTAPLADSGCTVFCAADLHAGSVQIGSWRFRGSMQLSDTCPVTFVNHRIPRERYLWVPDGEGLRCISDYQRSWFHLLLVETYLARIECLHRKWRLQRSIAYLMSLNEVSCLKEYALRLLDDRYLRDNVDSLTRATAAMKLRVSWLARSTSLALHDLAASRPADIARLTADARELGYIKMQPTADEKILRSLRARKAVTGTAIMPVPVL